MIRRFCYWLAARLPVYRIKVDGAPYLDRHYLAGPSPSAGFPEGMRLRLRWLPWTIYLHRFHRGDNARDLHNHPWNATTIILWGGYREEYLHASGEVRARDLLPGVVHSFPSHHFHRVDLLVEGEAWTLFSVGKRVRAWGFRDRKTGKFIPWRTYLGIPS